MEGFNLEEARKFDWKIKNLIKTEAIINLIMSVLLKSLSFREFLQFLQLLNIREEDMEQLHQSFHHYKVAIRNGLIRVNNKINDSPRTPSQASGATDSMSTRNCHWIIATELLPLNYWHRYNLVVRLSLHGQSLGQMADGQELVQTWSSTLQEKPGQCLDQSVLYNSIMPPPSEKDFPQDKR